MPETKKCTNCSQEFQINDKDFDFYAKINVAEIKLFDMIKIGDNLIIEGVTTFLKFPLTSMQSRHKNLIVAEKGDLVGIKTNSRVRLNDVVYKVVKRKEK